MSDYIPNELLIDILSRLPVISLLRFTSVSKSWYSLITNPSFISKHLNQNSKRNSLDKLLVRAYTDNDKKEHYLVCTDDEKFGGDYLELQFPFKSQIGYFRIVGSCNGLICLCDDYFHDLVSTDNIVLWNPSIRRSETLPLPSRPQGPSMFVLGFGSHPITHEYKVVSIVYKKTEALNEFEFPPKAEVYTQGTGLWRGVDCDVPPYCIVEFMWSQAFVNGAVHWIAYDPSVVGVFRSLILLFDMGSELFSEIMLPPTLANQCSTCFSVKSFGDSLAVLCTEQRFLGSCCIWVMKEYGDAKSWTKLYDINLPGLLDRTLGFRKNGEVLLSTSNRLLLSYDPGTKTMTTTDIWGSLHSFNVDVFMETLVLLKGRDSVLGGQ